MKKSFGKSGKSKKFTQLWTYLRIEAMINRQLDTDLIRRFRPQLDPALSSLKHEEKPHLRVFIHHLTIRFIPVWLTVKGVNRIERVVITITPGSSAAAKGIWFLNEY